MADQYDKNLQIINKLDVELNIYREKTLKMSVLRKFVGEFSKTSGLVYNEGDLAMICEALEFMDVEIVDDGNEIETPVIPEETAQNMIIEGQGISYNDIELELNQLLNPKKPDFSQLARTSSSAELCKMILDDPDNYIKVMYAIRKQL